MRFAASSNEMFHLLLFAIGSNEFVLVAHDLVSGAVTANRHSHGDCQHPACIMLLGYHWADELPPAAPYRAPTTLRGRSIAVLFVATEKAQLAPKKGKAEPRAAGPGNVRTVADKPAPND